MKRFFCILCVLLALVCVFVACNEDEKEHTHTWSAWEVTSEPTCQAKGEEKRTCACGESETREIVVPHQYGEWTVSVAATCVAKGEEKRTCACGQSETRELAETGTHTYGTDNTCLTCQTAMVYTAGLEYILNSDQNSYTVKAGRAVLVPSIVIPWYYEGKPVTAIGYEAFNNCSTLTSINIPPSVTSIEKYAFYGCSSLVSITIPANVTSIDHAAFSFCSSLASITIPASVTSISEMAFFRCSNELTSIVVENGNSVYHSTGNCLIETASKTLISGCNNSVIPTDVTSIGEYAFYDCNRLTTINIPAGVTSIGDSAFGWCGGLASITIPASVTSIGHEAFYNCRKLTEINFNATAMNDLSSGVFSFAGEGGDGITVNIGANVTKIPARLFDSNGPGASAKIICVNFADNSQCTRIGSSAFSYCTSLTSINIPARVTSIGSSAFWGCTSLTSINIPARVTSIDSNAFWGCTSLALAIFANASGWTARIPVDVCVSFSASELADPYIAASYLRSYDYGNYFWSRTVS